MKTKEDVYSVQQTIQIIFFNFTLKSVEIKGGDEGERNPHHTHKHNSFELLYLPQVRVVMRLRIVSN